VETHRREVRDAILDAAWGLVRERGLLGVTMSQIAATAGIGRATLYKYFPDVEGVLAAWHERQIGTHLAEVAELGGTGTPGKRLEKVLRGLADIARNSGSHDLDLAPVLKRGHASEHGTRARQHLHGMVAGLIAEGAARGNLRADVPPDELSTYCLSAVAAAADLRSDAAVRRLVDVTLDALRPPPG